MTLKSPRFALGEKSPPLSVKFVFWRSTSNSIFNPLDETGMPRLRPKFIELFTSTLREKRFD